VGAGAAGRGGDFRRHRKPAGPATYSRGQPVKARLPPPQKKPYLFNTLKYTWL
jgi:hypothetical protein